MSNDEKVVQLQVTTKLNVPPDRILENNIGEFSEVVLMGFDHNGRLMMASSHSDAANVLLLLERFKTRLLEAVEEADI